MPFLIRAPGTHSLLVDFGRPHHRSLGVPLGGAADRAALALGNALLGNEPAETALEITLAGPVLEATAPHAVVVSGARFALWVNDSPRPAAKSFTVRPGDVLRIGTTERGLRGYLCVVGGFESPVILGSRSALEPIRAGQQLVCRPSLVRSRLLLDVPPVEGDSAVLRALQGSHAGEFDADDFVSQDYTVAAESNRMGSRLQGRPLARKDNHELLSAPVCPGTVQITNDGQAIVLGVDAQTIGGYPRIAQVISADLDKLGQLRPGQTIRFQWVDRADAESSYRARQAWLQERVTRLRHSIF